MKKLTPILVASLLASVSFGADMSKADIQKLAAKTANESVKLKKEASQLEAKIAKICAQERELKLAIQDLSPEQKGQFLDELKYQNRQALAKLKRDDIYNERVCRDFGGFTGPKQPGINPKARFGEHKKMLNCPNGEPKCKARLAKEQKMEPKAQ